jgi:hypothetical protein
MLCVPVRWFNEGRTLARIAINLSCDGYQLLRGADMVHYGLDTPRALAQASVQFFSKKRGKYLVTREPRFENHNITQIPTLALRKDAPFDPSVFSGSTRKCHRPPRSRAFGRYIRFYNSS